MSEIKVRRLCENRALSPYITECPCYREKGEWTVTTTHIDSRTVKE